MTKKRPKWISDRTAAENAKLVLPELAESFFRSGRKISKGRASTKALHEFRLDVKKFRYYLEVFRPCYGPGLKHRIEKLRRIQDHLGALNDCEVTKTMLADAQLKKQPDKALLLEFLDKEAARQKDAFIRYWREKCDAPGQVKWWTDYLKRFAGVSGTRQGARHASAATRSRKTSSRSKRATKNRETTAGPGPQREMDDAPDEAT